MAQREPWYVDGLRFACTQCGNCCTGAPGYVWVSEDEIAALARLRGMEAEAFRERHTRRVGRRRSLLEHANGDCEFLATTPDGRRVCSVYQARPLQCRTWPFWQSNVSSRRAWAGAALGCPGMNKGALHELPVIRAALDQNRAADLPL